MAGNPLRHAMARMGGRDPHEENRASTPLELFFDLTFAIALGVAAGQLAEAVASGQAGPGLLGFGFGMFAVIWAWINFSWFASAYDTDDWVFRLVTMVQMTGVLILAMGLQPMFTSIEEGRHVDNRVMVLATWSCGRPRCSSGCGRPSRTPDAAKPAWTTPSTLPSPRRAGLW